MTPDAEAHFIALCQQGVETATILQPGELAHAAGGGALSITGAVVHAG
jgi:hypothetical protein